MSHHNRLSHMPHFRETWCSSRYGELVQGGEGRQN